MDAETMIAGSRQHSIFTWSAGAQVQPLALESAKGSWLYLADGRKLLDFNSQSMNANLGHGHQKIVAALKAQLDEMPHAAPAFATRIRTEASAALVETLPLGMDKILFCLSGAEANENAFRAARLVTGRQKVLSFYRSYHGATAGAIAATGDPRRVANEPGPPGFIHLLGLQPYSFSFGDGAERGDAHLHYLEECIRGEGSGSIAALIIEPVAGANGVIAPPPGYLARLKRLLEKYGILMICDEVLTGFGRTGRFWACQRDLFAPDLLTMAKGMTCGYAPGGAVAFHKSISQYFEDKTFVGGLTCNSHPMVLAAVQAVLKTIEDEQILSNVAVRAEELAIGLNDLAARHACVSAARSVGLMGMLDLCDAEGQLLANLDGNPAAMKYLKADLLDEGVYAFQRWSHLSAFPPLNINADELAFGLRGFDRALSKLDQRLGL
jgi:taurine--2-oxoglutarate transaminase